MKDKKLNTNYAWSQFKDALKSFENKTRLQKLEREILTAPIREDDQYSNFLTLERIEAEYTTLGK